MSMGKTAERKEFTIRFAYALNDTFMGRLDWMKPNEHNQEKCVWHAIEMRDEG
ncbi:hypothetical protein LJC56_00640 [Christensenellaceae bacterium OttesenSCG-928-K19]|nr:hypothetical protein [Christensenellaceae bacterium OttesenSCG-928-K19]